MKTFAEFVAESWDASDSEVIKYGGESLPRGTVRAMKGLISNGHMSNKKDEDIKKAFIARFGVKYAKLHDFIVKELLD